VKCALLICPLLFAIAAMGQHTPATATAQSFRINGMVVNAVSGEPLGRVEVQIGPSQEQRQAASVMTGVDGRFSFGGLASGKYWLAAQRHGFPRQAFEQHGNFFTAIAVGPNLDSHNLVFRLQPHASISGTITDEVGEAVPNASVLLFRSGIESGRRGIVMQAQTQTEDRGVYHFGNVHPGTYYIAVSARPWYAEYATGQPEMLQRRSEGNVFIFRSRGQPGTTRKTNPALDVAYPVTYYSGSTDAAEATPVAVKMGDRVTADVTLIPVPAVHLRVTVPQQTMRTSTGTGNVSNHVPQNVTLSQEIFGSYESPVYAQQVPIGPGEIEISGMPPGRFEMKTEAFGRNSVAHEGQVDVSGDGELDAPTTPSVPITIRGKAVLNGRPLSRQGFLRIWKRGSHDAIAGPISRGGDFEVHQDHVDPGKYEVGVFNIPGAVVRRIAASGAKVVGQSLEIESGGTIQLAIELAEGLGEISGTALRDGKPVSGAMIVLVPQDFENNAGLIRRDQSDSDGTFSLRAVLPGQYTVLALENAWDIEWLNPSVLAPYLPGGTSINVAGRQKYDIKVKAQ
jgi:hypothetical protein